jgi:hypothetical protein
MMGNLSNTWKKRNNRRENHTIEEFLSSSFF